MNVQFFSDLAYSALALLIAVIAVYLALRLLGKLAKFVIGAVVIGVVLWFLFSEGSLLQILSATHNLPLSCFL